MLDSLSREDTQLQVSSPPSSYLFFTCFCLFLSSRFSQWRAIICLRCRKTLTSRLSSPPLFKCPHSISSRIPTLFSFSFTSPFIVLLYFQSVATLGIKRMVAVKNHIPCSCSLLLLLDSQMGYTQVCLDIIVDDNDLPLYYDNL